MKIACIVLGAVAVILGIVIVIVLLRDRKKKTVKAESQVATDSVASKAEEADTVQENPAVSEIKEPSEQTVAVEQTVSEDESEQGDINSESDTDDSENEEFTELKAVVKDGVTRYIVIKYSKSFQAKLIQSADETKNYYSELKNCLMSYGVKSRMSWKWEAFRFGRKTLAKFRLRGKTLSLVLALNPEDYNETKYHIESLADIACYADTPCMYRIKNDRRLRYAKELISKLMQDNGVPENPSADSVNYAAKFPYETTEALIGRKLIKVLTDADAQSGDVFMPSDLRTSVSAQEVDEILQDEVAAELIEKGDGITDRTKTGIINIDTLSQYFSDGETVTLDEIKKRIRGFKKTTYLKVLARGILDKKLTVEADDFSLQAVKMIVLIGGKAIEK